jgi:hypothetical protein
MSTDAAEDLVRKRVSSLKPSPENALLYANPDSDDPQIVKLASAIAKNGCDPLVITADNYIISGHRRHVALTRLGQTFVRCRVLPVERRSMPTDQYVALIREFNHQRHKSVAEQVREELVDIKPEDAYTELRRSRERSIRAAEHNGVRPLEIEGAKVRYAISEQKADHVKYVKQVVFTDRRPYWPLSVRGVHYPLLNYKFIRGVYHPRRKDADFGGPPRELPYLNDDDSYGATSDLLTRMRLTGDIPWEALDDPTRPFHEFRAFSDVREFVRQETERLFDGYWRDLQQSQPCHVECLVEKNTILHMALRVTEKYQIPTSSGRGFSSIDVWHDLYQRYKDSGKKRLIVIVLSDYDPEGEMIPQVGGRTLRDDFGLDEAEFSILKAGVTREQVRKYNLPPMNFAKESSSNHDWFVDRNRGDETVWELEALNPADMIRDLDNFIRSVIDVDLFNREVAVEMEEAAYLAATRKTVGKALRGLID